MVDTTLSYLAETGERPVYYLYEPPAGTAWRNTKGDRRPVAIHDARALAPAPTLDREGFELVRFESATESFEGAAIPAYYREVEGLVRRETGARGVRRGDGPNEPVRFPHNDYTESSGPQRVRDLLPDEADGLLRRRFAVVNVWKPIGWPVEVAPLAVCDARTIGPGDLVPTDLLYRDRKGEVYSMRFAPEHRWYYFPLMRPDEAMLLKCFDSTHDRARFTAHSAFDDPTSPADARSRESIEVRTLAFF